MVRLSAFSFHSFAMLIGRFVIASLLLAALTSQALTFSNSSAEPDPGGATNRQAGPAAPIVYGLTVPATHPRLYWTPARVAQAQGWVKSTGYALQTTVNVNRPLQVQDVAFACAIGNAAACSSLASWANVATNWADANCYGTYRDGCNTFRANGGFAMLAYDWAHSYFTPAQLASIQDTFYNTAHPLDITTAGKVGSLQEPANNFSCGYMRNDIVGGIAMSGEYPGAGTLLDFGLGTAGGSPTSSRWNQVIDMNRASGGSGIWAGKGYGEYAQEGTAGYGRYCLFYANTFTSAVPLLGRNLWSETTAYKGNALQTIYNTSPQKTWRGIWEGFSWGDDDYTYLGANCNYQSTNGYASGTVYHTGTGGCGQQSQYYGDYMQNVANNLSAVDLGRYAKQWLMTVQPSVSPLYASVEPSTLAPMAFSNLPLDYYSQGSQYFYIRNNWTANATVMVWQMGLNHSSFHFHQDAGSFQVIRKSSLLAMETSGFQGFTVAGFGDVGTRGSDLDLAHNVPLEGGQGGISVTQGRSNGDPAVTRLASQPGYAFLAADLSPAMTNNLVDPGHPYRQNPYVVSLVRELYYIRALDTLVVVDRHNTNTAGTSTSFIAHCKSAFVISSGVADCVDHGSQARYSGLTPGVSLLNVNESGNGATAKAPTYRLEGTTVPASTVSYQVWVVQFCDAGACNIKPTLLDSNPAGSRSGTFTITLDGSDAITINKGPISAGGQITVAAATSSLTNTVDPMAVSDSGPVWGVIPQ
ncbi:MAG: hypothetical protein JO041_13825 [Acidobacteria bacterium]|nr:hypothetical protein [Acidobacteriota bacterium]